MYWYENRVEANQTCFQATKYNLNWEFNFSICENGYNCAEAEALSEGLIAETSTTTTAVCKVAQIEEEEVAEPASNLVDQDRCDKDEECTNGKCVFAWCTGLFEGSNCNKHEICAIGLACSVNKSYQRGTCVKQAEAEAKCIDDYQCVNTAGCYENFCVEYYSKANGEETIDAIYCASAMVNTITKGDQQVQICDEVTLVTNECTEEMDSCIYMWDYGKNIYKSTGCSCDLKEEGRYCENAPVADDYKEWILPTSHTIRRFYYDKYWQAESPYPQCVQNSLNSRFLTISSLLLVFYALIMLI